MGLDFSFNPKEQNHNDGLTVMVVMMTMIKTIRGSSSS